MKKKVSVFLLAVIGLIGIGISAFASAGGSDDPLVSKSYVDEKISQVLKVISESNEANNSNSSATISDDDKKAMQDEIMNQVEKLIAVSIDQSSQDDDNIKGVAYVPVYAEVGKVVLGGEGTEMILRSGKADVYVTGVAGIVNATTGKELKNGNKASLNNIMIIPRNDGRGFKVTESAWFLIKGDYEIK